MTSTAVLQNGKAHGQIISIAAHDPEAERLLPCELILDPQLIDAVAALISADDIYSPVEREVCRSIFNLHRDGIAVDLATIGDDLLRRGKLHEIGGADRILEIYERCPHGLHSVYHAKSIAEKAQRRRISGRLTDALRMAADPSVETADLIDFADGMTAHLQYEPAQAFAPNRVADLAESRPQMNQVLLDPGLRRCETANIISVSKIGKSWLAYSLAFCLALGRLWLGMFATTKCRVLLLDNELHRATLEWRLVKVAEALGVDLADCAGSFQYVILRGKSRRDLFSLRAVLEKYAGQFDVVILDALYRMLPEDQSENDNRAMTAVYNELDRLAEMMQAAFVCIHHSSKGSQSDKRLTDIGAGAGAMSRAADSHFAMREHEEDAAVVLEAAVRSFAPVEPLCMRFQFPLWVPADNLDPSALKGKMTRGEEKQSDLDREADNLILDCCQTWQTRPEIKKATGLGNDRRDRAIVRLVKAKLLQADKQDRPRNPQTDVFRKTIHAN